MKATKQYFPVVLFIMLYKVVLTFESVDEIPKCDHSNESYWAVFSFSTVHFSLFHKMKFVNFSHVFISALLALKGGNTAYLYIKLNLQLPCFVLDNDKSVR